jgi:hypothetical protein
MKATQESETGIVDLLDRVLYKGLILNTDLIITVSGIPLIGLNLRAVLASVDTMLAHGMWCDWDKAHRAIAMEEEKRKTIEVTRFLKGESPIFRSYCSCWQDTDILKVWRPGTLYITDTRIVLNRREPLEILYESEFSEIKYYSFESGITVAGKSVQYIHLLHHNGMIATLHIRELDKFLKVIKEKMMGHNLPWKETEIHRFNTDRANRQDQTIISPSYIK